MLKFPVQKRGPNIPSILNTGGDGGRGGNWGMYNKVQNTS